MDRIQFLSSVAELVHNNDFERDDTGGTLVAKLGLAVRRTLPDWQSFGYLKFKDVLLDLEAQGLVRIDTGHKSALTVWPVGDGSPQLTSAPATAQINPLRPLHREIWTAFVSKFPSGHRFLNRVSGEVRIGLMDPPASNADWVEIHPIEQEIQRRWASDFIQEASPPKADELSRALDAHDWFRQIPLLMDSSLGFWKSKFNRHRSERVQTHVTQWQAKNQLPDHLIFAENWPERARQEQHTRELATVSARREPIDQIPTADHDRQIRDLTILAISKMCTKEMCELSVPIKYMIEVLRPDLKGPASNTR